MKKLAATFVFLAIAVFLTAGFKGKSPTFRGTVPGIVLWAWERPENLDFIDPHKVAVAFLARSIELSHDNVAIRPRLQPLRVPNGTTLIAVVRVATLDHSVSSWSSKETATIVASILRASHIAGVRGVQIDFDATRSERPFYRSLLESLRRQLPDSVSLSITALASWCLGDPWIADLPVDDAVPMLFRLGPDRVDVLNHLQKGGDFSIALSRQSVGVSTDEPRPAFPSNRRVYIFNPTPWNSKSYQHVMKEFGK